jgi:ribose transport system permease protein
MPQSDSTIERVPAVAAGGVDETSPISDTAAVGGVGRIVGRAFDFVLRYAMVVVLIVLAIVADILSPGFFAIANLRDILTQNAPAGLIAIGMTLVMIAGGFDLSVAGILAVAGVLFASFVGHVSVPLAVAGALVAGAIAGAFNGFVVTWLRVNPFVTTLGSSSIFAGVAEMYSHSTPIVPTKAGFGYLGTGDILGIPVSIIILAVAFSAGGLVLGRTVFGRAVYAVGGNREAARLSGIRVDLVRASTYLIVGLCAAVGGILVASQTGVGQAGVDPDVTLNSIAVVIIGGTSLLGGEGAMWRTLVGLLIFGTLNNLFDALALSSAAQDLVTGSIVIAAVALDMYARSRRR